MTWINQAESDAESDQPEVGGEIPPELDGLYLVADASTPDSPAHELHGIRIDGGRACWYRRGALSALAADLSRESALAPRIDPSVESALRRLRQEGVPTTVLGSGWRQLMGGHGPDAPRHFVRCTESAELEWRLVGIEGASLSAGRVQLPPDSQLFDLCATSTHLAFLVRGPTPARRAHGLRLGIARLAPSAAPTWLGESRALPAAILNAYESTEAVTVDLALGSSMHGPPLGIERYRLDAELETITPSLLAVGPLRWPVVHPGRRGLEHGSLFALAWRAEPGELALTRHDLASGQRTSATLGFGRTTTPPTLVPDPRRPHSEQHGYVLALVYDAVRHASDLWILDVDKLDQPPRAWVRLPEHVHGQAPGLWIPSMHRPARAP